MKRNNYYDFIIVGAGLAGITAALKAAKLGSVALITKSPFELSNSYWAQGGIAAVTDDADSFDSHIKDTLTAGRGLCNNSAVEILVKEGSERIRELINLGMPFDKVNNKITLGLEGGHSCSRILHAGGDATGREIINFLVSFIKNEKKITVIERTLVYKLIVNDGICTGVYLFNYRTDENSIIAGSKIILATGGASAIYERSTNPYTSVGEGVSLAYDAGADIENMEFVQFHPTSFYSESGETFLISEAVRGEGAYLLNQKGERFMQHVDNLAELAPRDVVAKAIFNEMKNSQIPFVNLDLRHLDREKIAARFSNIFEEAKKFGIDITQDLVPVAPAAHYMIGGIKTGLFGETNIKGLYAIGEVASTGVHGANRLASNSLLECLVFANRAVDHSYVYAPIKMESFDAVLFRLDENAIHQFIKVKKEIAAIMNDYVGIVRNGESLKTALAGLHAIEHNLVCDRMEYYSSKTSSLLTVSVLITKAALLRCESRGAHFRTDFEFEDNSKKYSIIQNKFLQPEYLEITNDTL